MYQGFRVVALVPSAGNARYLRLVLSYLTKENLFDEIRIWLTNDRIENPEYVDKLKTSGDSRLKFCYADWESAWTREFYYDCVDPRTIYYKIDTDDVYIHPCAIKRLLDHRLKYREPFVVSANVINNGLCDHLHQLQGNFDARYGDTKYVSNTYTVYSGEFAAYLHREVISAIEANRIEDFMFRDVVLKNFEHWSINNYVFFGADLAPFGGEHGDVGDEVFFGQIKPKELNRPVEICGRSIVVHHAFGGQRDELMKPHNADILPAYEKIAGLKPFEEEVL